MSGIGGKVGCPTDRTSNVDRLTYRLLAELDVPPPANPPAIVLTTTRLLSPLFSSPLFPLGGYLSYFGRAICLFAASSRNFR
ncbi:hypothetical protein A2U01_0055870, partial [Trifolium medium]|nr:hypothetical protein [Trifolium medium]